MEGSSFWTIIFTGATFFLVFLQRKTISKKQLLLLFILFISMFFWCEHKVSDTSLLTGEDSILYGTVVSAPVSHNDRSGFQIEGMNNERVQVYSNDALKPTYGDVCTLKGTYEQPSPVYHINGFDFGSYLKRQSVHWLFYADELICRPSSSLKGTVLNFRAKGIRALDQMGNENGDPHTAAILQALVYGERSNISDEHREAYQIIGVSHLLAVSGLHVGLVVFMVIFFILRLGLTKETSLTIVVFLLPLYMLLAGGAPSVVRASLMVMFAIIAFKTMKKVSSGHSISVVFIVLLFIGPNVIYHLGFQLSFLTSFVLIRSGKILMRATSALGLVFRVTLLAQLASLPIILHHFYEFSLLSLPFNLFFIPYISFVVLPLSIVTSFSLVLFPPIGNFTFSLLSYTLTWSHSLMFYLNDASVFRILFGKVSSITIAVLLLLIVFFFFSWERGSSRHMAFCSASIVIVLSLQLMAPYISSHGKVTMLDVGQGDAILIELPKREKVYLIDTGGLPNWGDEQQRRGPGERVILPHLASKGIKQIDKLILTHGHSDHIGETCAIIDRVHVKRVLYPVGGMKNELEMEVEKCLDDANVPVLEVHEGMTWSVGKSTFRILSPTGREDSENERSIVLKANMGGVRWLFTGDIERETEQRLVKEYPNLNVDVLKVAHHGSVSSSSQEFITHVTPTISLIPVGRKNRHGHPGLEVIERLNDQGAEIYRTDENGDIEVKFYLDRRSLEVRPVVD
ncbi:DNA internalization-related competence protein ComEC/Rec2 [Alteribacter aurantiacus]|uniref:DNA internalization-related competence protein ComEC/Rec2 n=1 Tax=Alteribacter aurantiacus TaxID=254410 RepID=UPI001FDEA630|nr:DNA internalization-related competence protein ComEC/Rec2 [Alteribacter aurantiacus]